MGVPWVGGSLCWLAALDSGLVGGPPPGRRLRPPLPRPGVWKAWGSPTVTLARDPPRSTAPPPPRFSDPQPGGPSAHPALPHCLEPTHLQPRNLFPTGSSGCSFKKLRMQTVRHPSSSLGETRLPGILNHMPPTSLSPLSWPLPPEVGRGPREARTPARDTQQPAGRWRAAL